MAEEKAKEEAVKLSLMERYRKNCWTGEEFQWIEKAKEGNEKEKE